MLTPEKFRNDWIRSGDQLIQYPYDEVHSLLISQEFKYFLTEAGLPQEAAPFLSFGLQGNKGFLVSVSNLWDLPESFAKYRVLGSNGYGDPVCMDESHDGSVVYLNHDNNFQEVFMNSSVVHLAESLLEYRHFVQKIIEESGEDAYLKGNVPDDLKDWIIDQLQRIDKPAIQIGCFWESILRVL